VPSVITMSEEDHTSLRKAIGRSFTTSELLDYEYFIDESASELIDAMQKEKELNISIWFQYFATEVVNRIAFYDSLGFLKNGKDVDGIISATMKRFDHWNEWTALPVLEYILMKSPLARWRRQLDSPLAKVSREKLNNCGRDESSWGEHPDLLKKILRGQAKYLDRISDTEVLGTVMSIISAGADTTAITFTAAFYLLIKHPIVKERLRDELKAAQLRDELSSPPRWKEVDRLPYLNAVLKEVLRLYPPFNFSLDRIVPKSGAVISGKFIPPGTEIGCQVDSIHRDPAIFGPDSETFRPERWLDTCFDQRKLMDRSFLSFSTGKRICMGRHIAWLELKKVLPLVLLNFEVSEVPLYVLRREI
jgi:cytochrome P450